MYLLSQVSFLLEELLRDCIFVCIKSVILSIVDSCACIEIQKTMLSFVNLMKLKVCITYSFCP